MRNKNNNNVRSLYLRWLLPLVVLLALATVAVLAPMMVSAHGVSQTPTAPSVPVSNAYWWGP